MSMEPGRWDYCIPKTMESTGEGKNAGDKNPFLRVRTAHPGCDCVCPDGYHTNIGEALKLKALKLMMIIPL